jgi:hypothetical protein
MSDNLKNIDCWLIGAGFMAYEYSKVLDVLEIEYIVFGRGNKSSEIFEKKANRDVVIGGFEKNFNKFMNPPNFAIVAVDEENLFSTCKILIGLKIKNILIEKPGSLYYDEFQILNKLSKKFNINLKIAYNRRFYQSVNRLKEMINKDNGILSVHFEFTEWSQKIKQLNLKTAVLNNWLLANSTHVIDLFIHLAGPPKILHSIVKGRLDWFNKGSIFVGSGVTIQNIPFSYNSNWESPGRWSIEISTRNSRYKLSPMEELKVINTGEIEYKSIELDNTLEENLKPGLRNMMIEFFKSEFRNFCDISDQVKYLKVYGKIQKKKIEKAKD